MQLKIYLYHPSSQTNGISLSPFPNSPPPPPPWGPLSLIIYKGVRPFFF